MCLLLLKPWCQTGHPGQQEDVSRLQSRNFQTSGGVCFAATYILVPLPCWHFQIGLFSHILSWYIMFRPCFKPLVYIDLVSSVQLVP